VVYGKSLITNFALAAVLGGVDAPESILKHAIPQLLRFSLVLRRGMENVR